MVNFMFLIILHIIGDFYLQTTKVARCKSAKCGPECEKCKKCNADMWINVQYLVLHSFLYIIPFLVLYFMMKWSDATIIVGVLLVSHGMIDLGACYCNKKAKQTIVFLSDQFLHLGIVCLISYFSAFNCDLNEYNSVIEVILVGLALIMPCSIMINKLFEDVFSETIETGMFDIGSLIGIMERALTILFAYFGNFASIAIIITVKTWARSNDIKDAEFRNKYLLGTLTSLVLALLLFMIL